MRLACLLLLLLVGSPALASTVRMGLFVGNDVGLGPDEPLHDAEREAGDLARLFQEMGGLSRDRTIVLAGTGATRLKDTVEALEGQIREANARGDKVLLVFYYSGHASSDGLHMAGDVLPMDWVRRWLESSAAQTRVAFVDACESGTLARTRGGTPVDVIDVSVDDRLTASGLAIITSTGPLSVARESEQFGGGVFSRALFTGLRGSADEDADGAITLEEAYSYAFQETVIGTASGGSGIQRPEFRKDLEGVGEVVLTRVPRSAAGLVLAEELEGIYTVVSATSGQVVARVDKDPGVLRRINLPPGRYVVRKVRTADVLVAELDLAWGGDRWVEDAQMTLVPLGDPLARGAGAAVGAWALSTRAGLSTPMAARNPLTFGAEVAVRNRFAPNFALELGAGFGYGLRWTFASRLENTVGRGFIALSREKRLPRFDLQYGLGAEVLWLAQTALPVDPLGDVYDGAALRADQVTGGPLVQVALLVPMGAVASLEAGVRGALYPVLVETDPSFFVMGQIWLGASYDLGRKVRALPRR